MAPTVTERDLGIRGADGAIRLRVAEAGQGGRPFLLVHGFTGGRVDFAEWLVPLAERGWHAVAPDLRGHGLSDAPDDEASYTLEAFVADVAGLLDALSWPSAVVLGHSMGGMVAQMLALGAPERLEALVLMDTSHGPVRGVDPVLADLAAHLARTEGMAALLAAQNALESPPLQTAARAELLRRRPDYDAIADAKMLASAPAMYAAMAPALIGDAGNPDRLSRLGRLDLPTLVLVGEHDRPFLGPSRRMAEAIAGARLAVVAGGGHSPQWEAPGEWWAALVDFLDGLES